MIKNIVFDLGRVVINFDPVSYLKRLGLDDKTSKLLGDVVFEGEEWKECDEGKYGSNKELIPVLIKRYPEYQKEIELALNEKWEEILTLKEESAKLIKKLKQQGFNIYILSNLSLDAHNAVKKYDCFNYVDGGIYSYQAKLCKPDRRIYTELIDKYNLEPEETIFIDDREENIRAAEELGIYGIVFKDAENAENEIQEINK